MTSDLHRGRFVTTAPVALTLLMSLSASPVTAQGIPDEFTNLKVLPKDIGKQDLVNAMRGFAMGLGVRCEFCHVGEPGQPLSTFDFASDDKETKLKAREMLRMVDAINSDQLTKLVSRSEPPIEVRCATCHHGQSKPRTLVEVLLEAYSEGGVDAAASKYVELRDQYYGSWTFDFGEFQLVQVGQRLGTAGHYADGIQLLTMNLEHFPNSSSTHFAIGEIQLTVADTSAAIVSYKKSLELAPGNRAARRRLADLGEH
jgi:hypothetical protein